MPTPTYRAAVGFAKDAANVTLTAAVNVGAVTLPVSGTGVVALSTVTIIDGPNSEQRAVTAGGGSTSLTVAALTNAHSANAYVVSQLTASLGPADWMPVTTLKVKPNIAQLPDAALRGSAVVRYGSTDGVRYDEITIGGPVFTDTLGYLIGGVTGAVDFTGGTPNTFAFSVKNTGDTQPTPLQVWVNNGIDTRLYAGARVSELTVTYDTTGLLTYQATLIAYAAAPVAALTPTFSTITPVGGWQVQASINGVAVQYVPKCDVTIKRPVSVITTLQNLQDPYKLFAGPQDITGSLGVVPDDNTEKNRYLTNTQPPLDLLFTAVGANPVTFQVHLTKANYIGFDEDQTGSDYLMATVPFEAIANTTDATTAGTGYAMGKITIKSTKSTGTYV